MSGRASWMTYYFWVELIDARGNTAGPQPIGHVRIRHSIDTKLVDHGNNIVAEGDTIKFNGSNSYTRFADIAEAGVDYGEFIRSGSWSMTFWIKSLVDPSDERRFISIRRNNDGMVFISNQLIASWGAPDKEISLEKNTWYFFALSAVDHQWVVHTSADDPFGPGLATSSLGRWDASGVESNRMFIGINNGWGTHPDPFNPFPWDGYATKITIYDRPLTGEEATGIYNSSSPVD
jgi:hypothetical protein